MNVSAMISDGVCGACDHAGKVVELRTSNSPFKLGGVKVKLCRSCIHLAADAATALDDLATPNKENER